MAEAVEKPIRAGYYRVELFKTVWEVPVRYQEITAIGTGAYGTVWYVSVFIFEKLIHIFYLVLLLIQYIM